MPQPTTLFRGNVILPDRILGHGEVRVSAGRIVEVGPASDSAVPGDKVIEAADGYISPGFVDLHVHGGMRADFMDGTDAAFETVLNAHARHGTTSLAATTTVAPHDQI